MACGACHTVVIEPGGAAAGDGAAAVAQRRGEAYAGAAVGLAIAQWMRRLERAAAGAEQVDERVGVPVGLRMRLPQLLALLDTQLAADLDGWHECQRAGGPRGWLVEALAGRFSENA